MSEVNINYKGSTIATMVQMRTLKIVTLSG